MSPMAFEQQVNHLLAVLHNCHDLCNAIRRNRDLGPTTHNLDALQTSLATSTVSIERRFHGLREIFGSQMDVGDDISRDELNRSIRNLQSQIQPKLDDISNKRRSKGEDGKKKGFGEMNKKWLRIEEDVVETLESLGQRIEDAAMAPPPTPQYTEAPRLEKKQPQQKKQPKPRKPDEIVMSLAELDRFVQHMKISWFETIVAGKVLYVNCFDEKISQWEQPEGAFIRYLTPKKTSSGKTWQGVEEAEKESRRRKERKERKEKEAEEKKLREEKEAIDKFVREELEREMREREEKEAMDRFVKEEVEREFKEREKREWEEQIKQKEKRERDAFENELRERERRDRELRDVELQRERKREAERLRRAEEQQANQYRQQQQRFQGQRPQFDERGREIFWGREPGW